MAPFADLDPHFGYDTPVLRLNRPRKDPDARWVLWPVFVWRVVAPLPKERRLNLFQHAVLGLARAGVTRVADLSDRLLIAPDLAGLVLVELQEQGLVDHAGALTDRGKQTLEDIEEEPADEVRVGHVLSNPFTGKLWPRFLTGDLPVADVDPDEDGRPVLLSGSAGDPWKDRAFCMLPGAQDRVTISRPGVREILRAARRHRRQRDLDDRDDERDVPRLQSISFVDDYPHLFLLALRVHRHASGDWMVDDPFGHGESVELRGMLEERLDATRGLRGWLSPILAANPVDPTLAELQAEASWRVEERLTLAIRQHASVRDRLVEMQRALLEAEGTDAPVDKWDDVLVKAQRAVERVLHLLLVPYRGVQPPLYSQLAKADREYNRGLLDRMAVDLGFTTPLPKNLACVRRGKVQAAEQGGGGSLRPLIVLTLLGADHDEGHPLRRSGQAVPELLHRLNELATARDRAAHDGAAPRSDRVNRHVETVYLAVEALLLAQRTAARE